MFITIMFREERKSQREKNQVIEKKSVSYSARAGEVIGVTIAPTPQIDSIRVVLFVAFPFENCHFSYQCKVYLLTDTKKHAIVCLMGS
jgi:hypothetical protein